MGFFNFFKDALESKIDLSILKTDIHSHLIPKIDDGVKSIEESIQAINELSKLGYKKLIITPHIISDHFLNTPEIINAGLEQVKQMIIANNIPINIEAAAEYYIDFGFREKIQKEKLLTFGNNYVLVELSYLNPPQAIEETFFELQASGYNVILAHPSRYLYWRDSFDIFKKFKDKNIFFQLNITSLSSIATSTHVKKLAEKLIENNMIEFIGTDVHGLRHIELIKSLLQNKHLKKLINSGNIRNALL